MGSPSVPPCALHLFAVVALLCAGVLADNNWDAYQSDPECVSSNAAGVNMDASFTSSRTCKWVLNGPVEVVELSVNHDQCRNTVTSGVKIFFEDTTSKRMIFIREIDSMSFEGRQVFITTGRVGLLYTTTDCQRLISDYDEYDMIQTMPQAARRFRAQTGSTWTPEVASTELKPDKQACLNGGRQHRAFDQKCFCPPGFAGLHCEKACGPNHYGEDCKKQCSTNVRGCRGIRFCALPSMCYCAAGFHTTSTGACNSVCSLGRYGADCTEECGKCGGDGSCDPYSGRCLEGCKPGYTGPSCLDELPYLKSGWNITEVDDTSLTGLIQFSKENVAGLGNVSYYEVQYKEPDSTHWQRSSVGSLQKFAPESGATLPIKFVVTGLGTDAEVDIRIVLLDEDLHGHTPASQYLRVRTAGPRRLTDLRVVAAEVKKTGSVRVHLNWTSSTDKSIFSVKTEMVSVRGCGYPDRSSPGAYFYVESPTELMASGHHAVLEELQPGARHRITVTDMDSNQWASIDYTSPVFAPPQDSYQRIVQPAVWSLGSNIQNVTSPITEPRVELRSNSSALIRWETLPHAECAPWLVAGYRWSLWKLIDNEKEPVVKDLDGGRLDNSTDGFYTSVPMVALSELEPLTKYSLSVSVISPHGQVPDSWTTALNFTTLPSAPDAPRDLSVYRLNRTSLWLRWRAPAHPSGALRYYTVTMRPAQSRSNMPVETKVGVDSQCAAFPGMLCHAVHRLRPNAKYLVAVSATNEHSDQPGEHAEVTATLAKWGSTPPQRLEMVRRDDRSVTVRWGQPNLVSDPFYFEVQVTRHWDDAAVADSATTDLVEDAEPVRVHVSQEQSNYEYTASGLQPDSPYQIAVSCGYGGQPVRLDVSTLSEVQTTPPALDQFDPIRVRAGWVDTFNFKL